MTIIPIMPISFLTPFLFKRELSLWHQTEVQIISYKTALKIRQSCSSILTELGNESNGFVERFQWNCSTKSMEWLNEINGMLEENWRKS
jgi:hypothetical protein